MNVQTVTPVDLKQQIHEVVEQLPEEQLPDMLHFSETLLNGKNANGTNGTVPIEPQLAKEFPSNQPWLKYSARLKNYPDWDEWLEAIAEARREVDDDGEVI